jgi:hypothetical protein
MDVRLRQKLTKLFIVYFGKQRPSAIDSFELTMLQPAQHSELYK